MLIIYLHGSCMVHGAAAAALLSLSSSTLACLSLSRLDVPCGVVSARTGQQQRTRVGQLKQRAQSDHG